VCEFGTPGHKGVYLYPELQLVEADWFRIFASSAEKASGISYCLHLTSTNTGGSWRAGGRWRGAAVCIRMTCPSQGEFTVAKAQ
jgi:hypothetical protein